MATSRLSKKNEDRGSSRRPVNINAWNKDHVRQWMQEINVDEKNADILYNQGINGDALLKLKQAYLLMQKLSNDAKELIFQHKDLQTPQQNEVVTRYLQPRPFNSNAAYWYIENSNLDVTETGPIDLIQPCHEYKEFTNTKEEKYRMKKYIYEVIRFAAACMNSRTNGTIHFGVADKPHGHILGISVPKNDDFDVQQNHAIKTHFKLERQVEIAKMCIRPPRFVEVLKADRTSAVKYVIEVDVEPSSIVCEELYFNTYDINRNEDEKQEPTAEGKTKTRKERKNDQSFFIRDGSSSRNLITAKSSKEYEDYIKDMPHKNQLRKDAEEKHLSGVRNSAHGSELCEMITGGTHSMDRSYFASYIVVVNKSHPDQLKNLDFLLHMKNLIVLYFDPQSTDDSMNTFLQSSPAPIKIVFHNGRGNEENPSDADHWLTPGGFPVHDIVPFMCQKMYPPKKHLVIFLLLSQVSDTKDPLVETFNMFVQELKGQHQILCISDNETTYSHWKGRHNVDISRCISELSFAEVNGTILSLWSENRKSMRFLPCGGGSNVVLSPTTEQSLDMLSVLCVNQCEGGNEDKQLHEENFYKGGKVSWWNFFFSEQPGSMSVIKFDKLDYIVNTMIPNIQNQKRACVFFSIYHSPGFGGTTLAMHVLWTLKDKYRCAVLKETTDDYSTAAKQVVQLLTYEAKDKPKRLPVLLMNDHFPMISEVLKLQHQIEKECLKQNIFSRVPQVIIVNCMRVESCDKFEGTNNTVSIPDRFSETEMKQFQEKMEELKKTNTNTETFFVSMIMNNFSPTYIQRVVKNNMNGFNFQHKPAQLFAILVLLHVYGKSALLSVSACEEFLDLKTKAESIKVEDAFGKFSFLLKRCTVDSKVTFEGMMVIHSSVAKHCLEEILTSHGVTKAEITNLLLTTDLFHKNVLGKQKLMEDVHNVLVKGQYSAMDEDFVFSPLIQHIMKETPGKEETVLLNAAKCLTEDAVIFQLLARYYYIKKQDFKKAMDWAKKAKDLSKDNSYVCDTVSQVLRSELKHAFDEDRDDPIKPDSLDRYFTLAESAAEACKETQQTADKEAVSRLERENDYNTYNTAGHLGELQTGAIVIRMLQRTTTPNNCLSQVLLGKITIEDLSREKPQLKKYCDVLQKHKCFLLQLKDKMKKHFDFFKQFVNLVPFFPAKEKQKELTMCKVYFQQYTELFCKANWSELIKNEHMNLKVKIEQTRECLERNKGDSYTGLLQYLYEEDSASTLEEIIQQYHFILKEDRNTMDTVNFIYANVILSNINHESQYITPYQELCKLLFETITHAGEILPLHYIKVLLLWQEKKSELQTFLSQIKESFSKELKPLSNGKRVSVHFYLGKDKGYSGLISQRDITRENISTQWNDERIWKKVRNSDKLLRVSGEIRNNLIWMEDVNVMVDPMFRSQLHKEYGTKVTFFIGFSMNGPVALDIL